MYSELQRLYDCFGGCVDPGQGFHGLMDEVRLWKTALGQEEIVRRMRWSSGLEGFPDLVGWWKFDEPNSDPGIFRHHTAARDASGHGNDLQLETPPRPRSGVDIPVPGSRTPLRTGALEFRNGLAINKRVQGFPSRSFTVEMWAKGAKVQQRATQLFSYAAQKTTSDGYQAPGFLDDAVRIERLLASSVQRRSKYGAPSWIDNTGGAVALHVNSNENTDNPGREAVIMFDAKCSFTPALARIFVFHCTLLTTLIPLCLLACTLLARRFCCLARTDDQWHHVAVTWEYDTGTAALYLDGQPRVPFYKSDFGAVEERSPLEGGVGSRLAAGSSRDGGGALVLGQVLLLPNFLDFPSSSLTLEFWMTSIDRCRPGVPFSYAVGDYNNGDNAFLLFNYNSWRIRQPRHGPGLLRAGGVLALRRGQRVPGP
ncbi:hypothetical protein VOLCADRAFT_86476 [Volvox carteri f. nagariensis]|uniref:Uncharacterized protein n=1 Tax=Volvox carteri f. nagariensis TaxID=3068 RepID=D8TGT6_VOLCA|nr:uncharacterized protein VOLCADRAFT_86476 [Volvox carteri f. nagariensis]EFJ52955.1 hypothetical protein VOLCADRAFT_86476 [Volvox carteri f. nagariensis]|eukprot:XP_002945960.1 hypothetical protein VOLCADRAFT_86476 [Volvox carteri f. nagariensis]